jgi:hypothetical protein
MIEETVYDPTEVQLKTLDSLGLESLKLTDLAKPQVVQLLIQQQLVLLTEVKAHKNDLTKLRDDNMKLRDDREEIRIKLAQSHEHENLSWIEIPISFLGGFAINILATDPKNGLGWTLLILSLCMLVFLRISNIASVVEKVTRKDKSNAKN